ncbi:hypothetical protein PLICRDRAFT_57205 [Plicaturopsis crispa FD-325 SS-3]|uniref:non-specific serine/threonine protein kinase n=1 Tax=Plicaturopsis crispa FD-325 SS-3 TaxID=944288 RepID=A0A0C9SLD0_PLICR|nr:hypothetical protein PLICRDRAFT_57205 [Plicaturopsis crispa FD-325 SS-3]
MSITSITIDLKAIRVVPHDLPIAPESPTLLSAVQLKRIHLADASSIPVALAGSINVTDIDVIHRGRRATVYRARIHLDDEEIEVVLKIVRHYVDRAPDAKILESEAGRYENELSTVQGDIVPWCFGFFRSNCNGLWISCLVLQHCGEPIDLDFSEMDRRYRYKTIAKLARIHDLGLSHGDLQELNVLNNNGEPVIIDFECAKSHECYRDILTVGQYRPFEQDFGCGEIYDVVCEMCLWRAPYFKLRSRTVEKFEVNSAEDIVAKITVAPEQYNQVLDAVRPLAEEIIAEKKVIAEELRQMDEEDKRILAPLLE